MTIKKLQMPADNERFGAMAAVTPQTILWEIERYYPAANVVESRHYAKPPDVSSNAWATVRAKSKKKICKWKIHRFCDLKN